MHGSISHLIPKSLEEVCDRFDQKEKLCIAHVTDVLLSEELTNQYYDAIGTHKDLPAVLAAMPISAFSRGAILFFVLHRLASLPEPLKQIGAINRISSDESFLSFFLKFHKLPDDVGLRTLSFHASGTTSFIFKALSRRYGQCALKVIQAPYIRLPSIRSATANYAKNYGLHTKHSPKILDSSETWIMMEFIEGANLNDYLVELRRDQEFLSDKYISSIASIFHLLTEALSYYEQLEPQMIHGDLTPFNIMVQHDGDSPVSVQLIDFGPNYVLKDRVGSRRIFVEAFSRTELFTAPEVVSGKQDASLRSDLYSLGMIGLDLLSREPLRKDTVGVRLREIWQNPASLGIAQIIEDLIDEEPSNRVLILDRHKKAVSIYEELDEVLQDHVDLYKDLVVEGQRGMSFGTHVSREFKPDVWQSLTNIARIVKLGENPYNNVSKWQLVSSQINALFQAIIVSSFLVFTLLDLKIAFFPNLDVPFSQLLTEAVKLYAPHFVTGDVWHNLPGRMVAVTFGLIAARYYANIYAVIRVMELRGPLTFWTNFFLRANSVTYFVPIMIAIVYAPTWWPYCAFAGTLVPAINNAFCWWTARRASNRARGLFSIETFHRSETDSFLDDYQEWWIQMLIYSFSILVIGLFLSFHLLADEWMYAALICIVNTLKIYRINCGKDAPYVCGHLSRQCFSIRRWSAKTA